MAAAIERTQSRRMTVMDGAALDRPPTGAKPGQRKGMTREERVLVIGTLRRYFAWVDNGRASDGPLRSGVSRSTWEPAQRVKSSRSESFGPGACVRPEDEDQRLLEGLDGYVSTLPNDYRQILWWKSQERGETETLARLSNERIAEELHWSVRDVQQIWASLALRVLDLVWPREG